MTRRVLITAGAAGIAGPTAQVEIGSEVLARFEQDISVESVASSG